MVDFQSPYTDLDLKAALEKYSPRPEGIIPVFQGVPVSNYTTASLAIQCVGLTRTAVRCLQYFRVPSRIKMAAIGWQAQGTYAVNAYTNPSTFTVTNGPGDNLSNLPAGVSMCSWLYELNSQRYIDPVLNFTPKSAPIAQSDKVLMRDVCANWAANNARSTGLLAPPFQAPVELGPGWYAVEFVYDVALRENGNEKSPRLVTYFDAYGAPMPGFTAMSYMDFPSWIHETPVAAGWTSASYKNNWATTPSTETDGAYNAIDANYGAIFNGTASQGRQVRHALFAVGVK